MKRMMKSVVTAMVIAAVTVLLPAQGKAFDLQKAPEGKESNWLPTDPKRRFFLLSRFYGPEPGLFDGSFVLNNIELVK